MFGAPDNGPTYLFFLLGLKYDRLHLPILGRLARAMRNPATIAKLRSLSSPDQVRALLLKEDAAVREGHSPEIQEHGAFKPKLDRTLRLRAIRRLQSQKQAEIEATERRPEAEAKAARAKARAAKGSAARSAPAKPTATKPAAARPAPARPAAAKQPAAKPVPASTPPLPPDEDPGAKPSAKAAPARK
jgi:hypothetical protein